MIDTFKRCVKEDDVLGAVLAAEALGPINQFHLSASGGSLLYYAAGEGNQSVVEALISKGANLNAKSSVSLTPLMVAAQEGHEDVVLSLLEAGAEINMQDNQGYTALYLASLHNRPKVVELLLRHSADVSIRCNESKTPLHVARGKSSVNLLVAGGAYLNAMDNYGNTPLHVYVRHEFHSLCWVILSLGARADIICKSGLTAIDLADTSMHAGIRNTFAAYKVYRKHRTV